MSHSDDVSKEIRSRLENLPDKLFLACVNRARYFSVLNCRVKYFIDSHPFNAWRIEVWEDTAYDDDPRRMIPIKHGEWTNAKDFKSFEYFLCIFETIFEDIKEHYPEALEI